MKTIQFILGLHNHQPVGNFDHVFEEAYQKSYLPTLEALFEYPNVRLLYHTTGPLYDWLEEHHLEYFDLLKTLIQRNQIELMTGAYEEPILAVIPDQDKHGQIQKMSTYLRDRFGVQPRGMWMAERIWEPHLAHPLNECGVDYITLDDYHFISSGMTSEELLGYYRTDEQNYGLSIFPISKKLRYLIPFAPVEDVMTSLRMQVGEDDRVLVMADDGEKFGLWPGTYEWVHEKGWLKKFFQQLEESQSAGWLKMVTGAQYIDQHPPRGRVYLPTASYFEMSAWSLPAPRGAVLDRLVHQFEEQGRLDELSPFLKGGFWRNFLAKYDESNRMYRKMLWVSEQVQQVRSQKISKTQPSLLDQATSHLYRGQCNCAYWHGVFGGLYLPHLRHAVYQNLLTAERLLNQLQHPEGTFLELTCKDFDADGCEEIHLRNDRLGIFLSPREGGMIYELDYLPAAFNLLNTLRRMPEAYHAQVTQAQGGIQEGKSIHDQMRAKEEGLEKFLIYDRHARGMLLDHFLSTAESPQTLMEGSYYELGDFINQPYEIQTDAQTGRVKLSRQGRVVDNTVTLEKTVSLLPEADGLRLNYCLSNESDLPLTILFAPEFNFALLAGDCPECYSFRIETEGQPLPLNSLGIWTGLKQLSLYNTEAKFAAHLIFESATEVWRYPVETVSLSEGGFERIYQSSCVLPIFRLNIKARQSFSVAFRLLFERL